MLELIGFFVVCLMFVTILFLSWRNQQRINELHENRFQLQGGSAHRKLSSVVSNVNYNDNQLYMRTERLRLDMSALSDNVEAVQSALNRMIARISTLERSVPPRDEQ